MNSVGEGGPILGLSLESFPCGLCSMIVGLSTIPLSLENINMGAGGIIVALIGGARLKR